jgi:Pyruvate/2-oxoacid:ferredoxin oxidoreductase gamma subunit
LKVGPFRGPLIRTGLADILLALDDGSIDNYIHLLSKDGAVFLNTAKSSPHPAIDATGLAAGIGSPLMSNLVLLGFTLRHNKLFCDYALTESITKRISPERFREANIKALHLGYSFQKSGGTT